MQSYKEKAHVSNCGAQVIGPDPLVVMALRCGSKQAG